MADTTEVTAAVITNPSVRVEDVRPQQHARLQSPGTPGAPGFLSRERILDAANQTFTESGYDGTTIRAIAKRLGCSVGSIYRYFDDKRSLLNAMAERCFAAALDELTGPGVDWPVSASVYSRVAQQHPEMYAMMFWLVRSDGAGAHNEPPAFVRKVLDHWTILLGSRVDAERAWAAVHGAIALGRASDVVVREWTVPSPIASSTPNESASVRGPAEPFAVADPGEDDVTLL